MDKASQLAAATVTPAMTVRRDVYKGYAIIAVFFGSLLAWGYSMALSSAAIAPAEVFTEGFRKQVQHLNGGVVREIHMVEGQRVSQGEVLLTLEDNAARTRFNNTRSRLIVAQARAARLQAELQQQGQLVFSDWLQRQQADREVQDAMNSQLQVFQSRRALNANETAILELKVRQMRDQMQGDQQRLQATQSQLAVVRQELESQQVLVSQQLVTRSRLYTLETQVQSLRAEIAAIQAAINSSRQQKSQYEVELTKLTTEQRRNASEELEQLQSEILVLQQTLDSEATILSETEVRSPIDGIIVEQKIHTTGGVIQGGQVLADVVPAGGKLMLAARINPKDRDAVQVGQDADIRFTAFNQRSSKPVRGKIALISADAVINPLDQSSYYLAHVEMLDDPQTVIGQGEIYSGMQAEVMILTGSRSALEYLVEPLARSFSRSMREE